MAWSIARGSSVRSNAPVATEAATEATTTTTNVLTTKGTKITKEKS